MKKIIAAIFTTLLANTAFASWIAPVAPNSCTRDFNDWGQASSCACPHATRYEPALGQCVQGAAVDVTVDGVVASLASFEGDEQVTNLILTNKTQENYTLVLTRSDRSKLEELKAQDLNYRFTGEVMEEYDAGATPAAPLFIVKGIEILPSLR